MNWSLNNKKNVISNKKEENETERKLVLFPAMQQNSCNMNVNVRCFVFVHLLLLHISCCKQTFAQMYTKQATQQNTLKRNN